jgi:uncharacterized membrane protein YGL010W
MKSLQSWFDDYAVSHQNEKNIKIHFICVPAIFFSVIGLVMSIPHYTILSFLPHPILANWAFLVLTIILIFFYFQLSIKVGFQMLLFSAICLIGNYYISEQISLFYFSLIVFIVAWIGQFYGHKIEGKKPSFIKDLQFLLIGPAWIVYKVFR